MDRGVGRIYDTYNANCVVYTALGTIRSVEDVVANTLQAISASGDGESHHLNVAWSGDEDEGFYTSHLGFAYATNTGATMFGPPQAVAPGGSSSPTASARTTRSTPNG